MNISNSVSMQKIQRLKNFFPTTAFNYVMSNVFLSFFVIHTAMRKSRWFRVTLRYLTKLTPPNYKLPLRVAANAFPLLFHLVKETINNS